MLIYNVPRDEVKLIWLFMLTIMMYHSLEHTLFQDTKERKRKYYKGIMLLHNLTTYLPHPATSNLLAFSLNTSKYSKFGTDFSSV